MKPKTLFSIMGVVLVIILLIALAPFKVVTPGYSGVKVTLGSVNEKALEPGWYIYNPLTSSIHEMDIRTLKYSGSINTYTKDVQTAALTYTINYNLEAIAVPFTYQSVGDNWAETLLPQVIEGELKNTVGKWDAVDLNSNRDKAATNVQNIITKELAKKHVSVTGLQITNLTFKPEFEKSVEDKVIAIQKASEAQNNTVRIREEAAQTVISAKADAEAMRIKSDALSQNKNLVAYEAVQKWNGELPTYMLGNAVPMFNMDVNK